MPSNKKGIYVRVSTPEQAKGGESLDNQERKCREFAEKNGYNVIRVFREEGESGGTANRTQLKEAFKFCKDKNNNVSAVICYKVDRFSRRAINVVVIKSKKLKIPILITCKH